MTEVLEQLQQLARETHKTEAEVVTLAIEAGVKQLRREQFLGSYLFGRISRDEAIQAVGIDWVELAEKQREAMIEDISWARQ